MSAALERIKNKIYAVMNLLDKTGGNTEKYKNLFKKMSDAQLIKFFKTLTASDDEFLYLEVVPFKNEPTIEDIKKAADFLKVPLDEHIYIRDTVSGKIVKSKYPVPVGYIHVKKVQQMLVKKNSFNLDIDKRSAKYGTVSEFDKVGRISDTENYSLNIVGAHKFLEESLGPRSDNHEKKMQMYGKIHNEGYCNLADLNSDIESSTTINTINTYLLGAGISSNLVSGELVLPRTMKNKHLKNKK